ncbi:MAG TPA: hypothetical protein VFB59_00335, partial [Candidatus Saccharimonadales bacterium]|nr:hypothetical protein [Candidatus Saccharimonadales bacterium]
TQSPDSRWLLAQNTPDSFDLYDLAASAPNPEAFAIPPEIASAGTATTGWQEIAWAKDNKHVVVKRLFTRNGQGASEYLLLDRDDPSKSVNLSVLLGFTPSQLQLRDDAYDQYYAFDQPNGALFTASLDRPTPQPLLDKVLAFQSEGPDNLVYATSQDAPPGKTLIRLRQGSDNYTIRQVANDAGYLLELERFEDAWFVAAGASTEDRVYVYKNPVDSLKSDSGNVLVPVYVLKVDDPTFISFAPTNPRFVMVENGPAFAVYDVKNEKGYAYRLDTPVDASPGHATWVNEFYLQVAGGGTSMVFDYDGANRQPLMPLAAGTKAYFDPDYRKAFAIGATNALAIFQLRTALDR